MKSPIKMLTRDVNMSFVFSYKVEMRKNDLFSETANNEWKVYCYLPTPSRASPKKVSKIR